MNTEVIDLYLYNDEHPRPLHTDSTLVQKNTLIYVPIHLGLKVLLVPQVRALNFEAKCLFGTWRLFLFSKKQPNV